MKTGGYNSSVSAPGTKYIRYYLLLRASRRGSIWFQWGLAFIPSSSWTELCSPESATHLPRWHKELVTLSRLDHKSLLASRMPRTSRMTNKRVKRFLLLRLQVDSSALDCIGLYIFWESQRLVRSHCATFLPGLHQISICFPVNAKLPASLPLDLFIQAEWEWQQSKMWPWSVLLTLGTGRGRWPRA